MKSKWRIAPLLALCVAAGAAEPPSVGFWVNGAGVVGCGKVLNHLESPDGKLQVTQWIWGYLSAYNEFHDLQKDSPDKETVVAYVKNYCTQNPLKTLYNATRQMLSELGPAPPA